MARIAAASTSSTMMNSKLDYSLYGGAESPFPPSPSPSSPVASLPPSAAAAQDPRRQPPQHSFKLKSSAQSSSLPIPPAAVSSSLSGVPSIAQIAPLLTPSESSHSSNSSSSGDECDDEQDEDEDGGVEKLKQQIGQKKEQQQQERHGREYFALRRRRGGPATAAESASGASLTAPVPVPALLQQPLLTPAADEVEDEEEHVEQLKPVDGIATVSAISAASDAASAASSAASDAASASTSSSSPDFLWMMTEEPHRSRRLAILRAHPEVRRLMGCTRATAPLVVLVVATQLALAIALRHTPVSSWRFLLTAYAAGGALNQNIFLAIHEITHNLAFRSLRANKLLALVANIAIGVPYAMAFKGYHIEHHKFLGEDGIDTDLPSKWEAIVLDNVAGKTFFATFQIFFYALRPGFVRSQRPTLWHALNLVFILAIDALLVAAFGWKPLLYLLFSSFFAGSLHPCAAHFIAEHYLMNDPVAAAADDSGDQSGIIALSQETTSYYGPLNILCYNVGYHNEHHDFPSIPWTRLPQLRRIAHEFYDPLPSHASWPAVTWRFITDPSVGMWSRAKRASGDRGKRIDEDVWTRSCRRGGGSTTTSSSSVVSVSDDSGEEAVRTAQ